MVRFLQVRAMQIIDELEASTRGPYGGGVGFVSFSVSAHQTLVPMQRLGSRDVSPSCRRRVLGGAQKQALLNQRPRDCVRQGAMDMALALRTMVIPTNPSDSLYKVRASRPFVLTSLSGG